ncbi:hypothetical protein DMN91_011600 [Ooceraea biroi]|uniref:peptidylprolyl isomerase n=1 Tax=Ooceraea biroi TaxID=2015173 RepID=A0A3L8D6G6_OOCBI|nr:peptidyl-prolyl cis-trans isomerase D [Ooceraea biroi]RLU15844.1 hypothetical protein DMN91_011600 [Ooceraea biroi]
MSIFNRPYKFPPIQPSPFNREHLLTSSDNIVVFLDIAIGHEKVGRMVIELFKNTVPRAVENFRALCTGEKGEGRHAEKLHYKGSVFYKVVMNSMIQGGDIVNNDGTSGESIYGEYFDDNSWTTMRQHRCCAVLVMANENAKNTNSSKFIINIKPTMQFKNSNNVVFGKVIAGTGILNEINKVQTTEDDVPMEIISIVDCGELKADDDWKLEEEDDTDDVYPPFPVDWQYQLYNTELTYAYMETVIRNIKDSGDYYFAKDEMVDAARKYKKAYRYYTWTLTQWLNDKFEMSLRNLRTEILFSIIDIRLQQEDYRSIIRTSSEILRNFELKQYSASEQDIKNMDHQHNVRALLHRIEAYIHSRQPKLAIEDLQKVREINADNVLLTSALDLVKNVANLQDMIEE